MARRPRQHRLRRLLLLGALGIFAAAILVVGLYYIYVDHVVTQQFRGRRWTLPAQVFAAPVELYVGAPLSMSDLTQELARLRYRPRDKLDRPGSYRRQNDRIDIALRAARFADEARPAQMLSVIAGPHSIEALRDANGHLSLI